MTEEKLSKYKRTKYLKLILAIIIDGVGYASYAVPAFGEGGDTVWGPISGVLIFLLFRNHKKTAIMGVAEELIPLTDFVPTASITWCLEYLGKKRVSDLEN